MKPWIGVDFDGTLAHYDGYKGGSLGDPIPKMVDFVRSLLKEGHTVKVFTARACNEVQVQQIIRWTRVHLGEKLEVTNVKDYGMTALYDDRAFHVVPNTGTVITP